MITQERLKELLSYDPDTGLFTRKVNAKRWKAGTVTGSVMKTGYIEIRCDKYRTTGHRLAFLYMTGRFPVTVDHIDHDPANNKWSNLRNVSHRDNMKNVRLRKDNVSGVVGVSWSKACQKWTARIATGSTFKHLGVFKSKDDAIQARKDAETEFNFHINHGAVA